MTFLSPEIQALAKANETKSLFKREISCGIFQDCGNDDYSNQDMQSTTV
ncbi:hypothetical protein H0I23_06540 [Cellulophaga sp. HaHaR_3_176]|nr:hypothetical protein [Cellulophaga sp. HaHaR_3_176]QWX85291.1 hypothetical protein H0I23_06540 [Cellulophaga sp. HaHaR_3_176]